MNGQIELKRIVSCDVKMIRMKILDLGSFKQLTQLIELKILNCLNISILRNLENIHLVTSTLRMIVLGLGTSYEIHDILVSKGSRTC